MDCSSGDWQHQITCFVGMLARPSEDPYLVFIQVVLPLLAVLASTLVAIMSWTTARRATVIADQALTSENEREKRDLARRDRDEAREYELVLDDRLVALIEAFGVYVSNLNTWLNDVELLDAQKMPRPLKPTSAIPYTRLQGAMLSARGRDRTSLTLIDQYVRELWRSASQWKTDARVRFMVELVSQWRDETISQPEFDRQLADEITRVSQDVDTPDPRTSRMA